MEKGSADRMYSSRKVQFVVKGTAGDHVEAFFSRTFGDIR